jgi:hypothetical protein
MGDILEHLTSEDATIFLEKIKNNNQKVLVSVPYEYVNKENMKGIFLKPTYSQI